MDRTIWDIMDIMEPEWICVQIGICPEVHTAETKAEPASIVINTVQKWEMPIMYEYSRYCVDIFYEIKKNEACTS
jgi:hypothetical protein